MSVPSTSVRPPATATKPYRDRINRQLAKTVEGIIEIGRILTEAQANLSPKLWLDLITDELPFSRRTAEKLIKIAADTRITDARYREALPPHWTSLHELTFLDDSAFEAGVAQRLIRPDTERKEIAALRGPKPASQPNSGANRAPGAKQGAASSTAPAARPMLKGHVELAALSVPLDKLTPELAGLVGDMLWRLQKLGVECLATGAMKRSDLLAQIHKRLNQLAEDCRQASRDFDVQLIEDTFFQLETKTKLARGVSGALAANDIRSPHHEYHGISADELRDLCLMGRVVTKYTPLEFLDVQARIDGLAQAVLLNWPEAAASRTELTDLARTLPQAKAMLDAIDAP